MHTLSDIFAEQGFESTSAATTELLGASENTKTASNELEATNELLDQLISKLAAEEPQQAPAAPQAAPAPAAPMAAPQAAPEPAAPQAAPAQSPEEEAQAAQAFIQDVDARIASGQQIPADEMQLYNAIKGGAKQASLEPFINKVASRKYVEEMAMQEYQIKQASIEKTAMQKIAAIDDNVYNAFADAIVEDMQTKEAALEKTAQTQDQEFWIKFASANPVLFQQLLKEAQGGDVVGNYLPSPALNNSAITQALNEKVKADTVMPQSNMDASQPRALEVTTPNLDSVKAIEKKLAYAKIKLAEQLLR